MKFLDPILKGLNEIRDELRGLKQGVAESTKAVNGLHDLLILIGVIAAGLFTIFLITKWVKK